MTERSVIELLKDRRREPVATARNEKLGLVIEGGGMRGVISSAAADAFHQLGYADCFDAVYGTSAGAINGAYFLSGQINLGTSIYYMNLTGRRFINPFRWPGPLNIHYLFDQWITSGKRLNVQALEQHRAPLFVTVTDYQSGEPHYLSSHELPADEIVAALRASASPPVYSNNIEDLHGLRFLDGCVAAAIPFDKAVADGCTHIVCLTTQPRPYRMKRDLVERYLARFLLPKPTNIFLDSIDSSARLYNETKVRIHESPALPVLIIAPAMHDFHISNAQTSQTNLLRAARESMQRVALQLNEVEGSLKLYCQP